MSKSSGTSKVADRIAWLQGKRVRLHIDPDVQGQGERLLEGTYEDVHCMGREYFFVVRIDSVAVLVRTTDVSMLEELKDTPT